MADKPKKIKVYLIYSPEEKVWMANATDYWLAGHGPSRDTALTDLLRAFGQELKTRTDSLESCRRKKPLCKPNMVLER